MNYVLALTGGGLLLGIAAWAIAQPPHAAARHRKAIRAVAHRPRAAPRHHRA